ncbi:oxidoreductase [Rhodobacter lacus]|uniref:Oxidoreductase n=1 Tax=Rhodobacter lacus TaxID=1641972 RepID=A0ABW5A404_9RHOB
MQQVRLAALTAPALSALALAAAAFALAATLVSADAPARVAPALGAPLAATPLAATHREPPAPDRMPPLAAPEGKIVLTVTGALGTSNAPAEPPPADILPGESRAGSRVARFDDAMLAALPREDFRTTTIWTSGAVHFSGVPLRALLDRLGVQGGRLRVIALNDYAVEIPVADIETRAPLLADRRDGQPMTIRDKGPLWIIYPYDADPAYRNEVIYARSVWQVDRIEVLP